MGTVKGTKAKLLVILIVFMIVFSNCGFTLSAIATSDEFQVITNGFFKKDEIKFNAYFEDENGKEITETTENVNQKVRLILDILPQVEGYLKSANLKAVSEDGSDVNFKITGIKHYQDEEDLLDGKLNSNVEVNNEENKGEENTSQEEPEVVENTVQNNSVSDVESTTDVSNVVENTVEDTTTTAENIVSNDELSGEAMVSTNTVSGTSNTTDEDVVNEVSNNVENIVANETSKNTVDNTVSNVASENVVENTVQNNSVSENIVTNSSIDNKVSNAASDTNNNEVVPNEVQETVTNEVVEESNEDTLIDEEKVIEAKTEEATVEEDLTYDMKLISDNEIQLRNIIKDTKIVLELEYKMGEKLNVEDLMKNIHLQLSGTYINSDLEEVEVAKEAIVTLGWEYTKDVELTSEYTKFSPFEVGEIKGTIVENKISVKRDITDEKYLPIKNTSLEVGVPKVNGKNPIEINVICEKLLATRGEDTGNTTFVKDNWSYDAGTGKIQINVENDKLAYTSGMDEYVIIYRYEDMIDAENSDLDKNVKLKIEEYSGKENHIIEKEIKEIQSIKVDVGELITYNISSTEEKINKAKIYANYNNETPIYETEYTNQVNVNILTSDILEELKINCNQEVYKDVNGFEFKAEGIEYKRIKFSYLEITTLLVNGGEIVITNEAGEVLYTLNRDVIKTEEDCQINLNGQTGIIIYARNIAKNGSLNFELVKAIKGCNYEKSAFKNFIGIESRITAEVKYQKIEETLLLPTIGTAKQFEESTTFATLSMNKETLSTTKSNENVEIKIELNNDKENSDLYINPAFEVVFPKHVKEVTIQNANVLYENGLNISKIDTYKENDITKIRIELEGVQKTFSESSITNGTNIILNANIEVDEYTPKKEDQIKLYYCNEGVSTYQAQTKWSISKTVPNNILKTTNGFDVAIIKYQAPNGLIAINGIVNYDGNLSEIKSVKQGEVKKQIDVNASAKIMKMELLALNNTDNKCTDVVLLGRIPFAGVKDVITNEDLGTTTNTVMKDLIKEDIQNTNTVEIYYSNNAAATKELDNIGNGWTKEVTDINQVKSFLIVVKGSMEAGQVLRYTYDFEVPASLPYETNIEGSFGAFYNNNTDVAVVYESSVADTVGLTTEAGPKVEAKLTVDVGDGNDIGEARFLNYTLTVTNTGSMIAEGITINNPLPKHTILYEYNTGDMGHGNNNYIPSGKSSLNWTLDKLEIGESKKYTYMLKTTTLPVNEEQTDIYIENTASVKISNLAIEIKSNTVRNRLIESNLNIEVRTDCYEETIDVGGQSVFSMTATNISGKTLTNLKIKTVLPENIKYTGLDVDATNHHEIDDILHKVTEYTDYKSEYDENTRELVITIPELYDKEDLLITINFQAIKGKKEIVKTIFEFTGDEGLNEKSPELITLFKGPQLEVEQYTNTENVLERENVEFLINIKNTGNGPANLIVIEDKISENLKDVMVNISGYVQNTIQVDNGMLNTTIATIPEDSKVSIKVIGTAVDLDEDKVEKIISNKATITADYCDVITTEEVSVVIKENANKEDDSGSKYDNEEEPSEYKPNDDVSYTDNSNNNQETNNNQTAQNHQDSTSNNSNNNDSSSNNSKNNSNNNSGNTTNNSNSSNTISTDNNKQQVVQEKYYIAGKVWLDENKNSRKDEGEEELSGIKVQLMKNSSVLKATVTDGNGNYKFENLSKDSYIVAFLYDADEYIATTYSGANIEENLRSTAIENKDGMALTNSINLTSNSDNVSVGLQKKDTFNLLIGKYISKTVVTTSKGSEEYIYDNSELEKVEIKAKELNNSTVKFEYLIRITNTGEIDGKVGTIADYLPEETKLVEEESTGWYLGNDGNAYNDTLKETILTPGKTIDLKIVLEKQMNNENTGVVSNQVAMIDVQSEDGKTDNIDDNFATQEMLVLIKTGSSTQIIIAVIGITIIAILLINKNYIIKTDNSYKNKEKIKKNNLFKKIYK